MSVQVPLISQMDDVEETQWLKSLNAVSTGLDFVSSSRIEEARRTDFEVAVVANPDPTEVATYGNLKWVQSLWAGVERLLQELDNSDLGIVRLVDPQLAQTMSEAVLAWTMYLHRDMPAYASLQMRASWKPREFVLAKDRKVCMMGLGELGQASALRLQQNGFDVRGWSKNIKSNLSFPTFSGEKGLQEALWT